ncbi:hypothetical protein [Pseudomonas sp. MEJ086]|nr:hypothetical protein [Pseudomonas sp. MEJ086]
MFEQAMPAMRTGSERPLAKVLGNWACPLVIGIALGSVFSILLAGEAMLRMDQQLFDAINRVILSCLNAQQEA